MVRRRGGHKSKVAMRSAPLAEDIKPVHPGESGGQYKPLSDEDVAAVLENSFRILEEIGFNEATPHCIKTCTAYGAEMGDNGRLRMSREVVKKAIESSNRNLVLYGQDSAHDLHVTGSRVYFATAGAAVMITDPVAKTNREALAQDLYDMSRISDTCEHIHIFQRTNVLCDIKDNYAMDLNTTYNSVMGTTKHVGSSWTEVHHLEKTLKLLHLIADKSKDCDFADIVNRIELECPSLKTKIMLGGAADGFHSLSGLITKTATRNPSEIEQIQKTIDPCEPALFLLSGGTTGIPKLIPRTHNDYVCNSKLAAKHTKIESSSVLLTVLPIAHNLPLACPGMQGFMLTGAKVVLHKSTRAAEVFGLIEKYKVTHIHIVPALLIIWMHDPLVKEHDLTSIQVIQSGGQRLQPETRILTERLLVNCTVQENFGMAEGMLMYVRLDDPLDVRRETVGRAMCEDDEIMLLDENDLPVRPGEVGEFCARGPYTLRGYFNAPEHNARAFTKDGFYRSGDLMRQHKSGNYMVEGRKKDLINRGGEKISAEEVENLILGNPKIKNVACVAMPDPVLGEKMCAFVILKENENLTLDELNKMLLKHEIAKFKLPERLEVVDRFPLSTFGKVSKKDLVVIVAEKLQQEDKGAT